MAAPTTPAPAAAADPRTRVLEEYRKKLVDHANMEAKLRDGAPQCVRVCACVFAYMHACTHMRVSMPGTYA
jgi:hypothetical protein